MAARDLKARYVGSIFGLMWAVINPLAQIIIYGVVFGVLFEAKPDPIYKTESYFLFLTCGLLPWQFFSQTVNQSSYVISSYSYLVKKSVGFPTSILQIVTVLSNMISHFIALGVLCIILLFTESGITFYFPLVLLYVFIISIFTVGIGWIVSSLNVYLKDVQQVVSLLMLAWMYFTPIFYSASIIPASLRPIWKINPLYHMVTGYRYALLGEIVLPITDLMIMTGISVITFVLGGLIFRRLRPGFAEIL